MKKERIFSFRYLIQGIIIFTLICSVLLAIYISYSNTDTYLQDEFNRQVNSSEEYLNISTVYIFRGLKLWDTTYDDVLNDIARKISAAYIAQGRNFSAVNLNTIIASVPDSYHSKVRIDIINKDGIVEISTGTDKGLNFSKYEDFYQDLTRIREGSQFVPDRVVTGFNASAPLTKFAYLPTDDHEYIIQPALFVNDDQVPERLNLSYRSLINRVRESNSDISDISLYNSIKKRVISTRQKSDPILFPWTVSSVNDTFSDKETREISDSGSNQLVSYKYLHIGEDNSPSAKYMNLVGEIVFSTERVEAQKNANLILHIILAIIALVLVLIIGYGISLRLTRPIEEILADIHYISSGDLTHPVRKTAHLELNRIADAINTMIGEIQKSLKIIQISESRYFGLFHSSAHAIIILEGFRVSNMNKAASDLFGISESSVLGRNIGDAFGDIGSVITKMIQTSTEQISEPYIEEFSSFKRKEEEIFLNIRLTRVETSDGPIIQVQIQDITEQQKAYLAFAEQKALEKAYVELQRIFAFLPDPTFMIDPSGTVILWNKAMEFLTGKTSDEMVGNRDREYSLIMYGFKRKMLIDYALHPEETTWENDFEIHKSGDILTTHTWFERDGKKQYISAIAARLYNSQGEFIGAIESIRDITSIRKTQDALSLANKKINLLSKISRHDILNQITVLSGFSYLLSLDIQDPALQDMLTRMRNTIQVIQAQITFTREYQEIGSGDAIWINPVEAFIKQQTFFSGVSIEFSATPSNLEIFADPLLEKVMYNLIDNSIRHGDHVSKINLSVLVGDTFAEVVYEDNGSGVILEDKSRIFDQEFGRNSGYGLFLIREILSITGITIEEDGEYGKGVRFVLTIPAGNYHIRE